MPSLYPLTLDALTNPAGTDAMTGHAAQHANANDAIEALQAYIGVMGSTNAASLDRRVASLETGKEDIGAGADPLAYYILSKA